MGNLKAKNKKSKKKSMRVLTKKIAKSSKPAALYNIDQRTVVLNHSFKTMIRSTKTTVPLLDISSETQTLFGGESPEQALEFLEEEAGNFAVKSKTLKFFWKFRVSADRNVLFVLDAVKMYRDLPVLYITGERIDKRHDLYPQIHRRIKKTVHIVKKAKSLEQKLAEALLQEESLTLSAKADIDQLTLEKNRVLREQHEIRMTIAEKKRIEEERLKMRGFEFQHSRLRAEYARVTQSIQKITRMNKDAMLLGEQIALYSKLESQVEHLQKEFDDLTLSMQFLHAMPDMTSYDFTNYRFIYNQNEQLTKAKNHLKIQKRLLQKAIKQGGGIAIRSASEYDVHRKNSLERVASIIKTPDSSTVNSLEEIDDITWQDMLVMPEVTESFVEYLHRYCPRALPLWVCFQDLNILNIDNLKVAHLQSIAQTLFDRYIKLSAVFWLELPIIKDLKSFYMKGNYATLIQKLFESVQEELQHRVFVGYKKSKVFAEFQKENELEHLVQYEKTSELGRVQQAGAVTHVNKPGLLNIVDYEPGSVGQVREKREEFSRGVPELVNDLLEELTTILEDNYSLRDTVIDCERIRLTEAWSTMYSKFNELCESLGDVSFANMEIPHIKAFIINLYNLLISIGIIKHGVPTSLRTIPELEEYLQSFYVQSREKKIYVRDLIPLEVGVENYAKIFNDFPKVWSDPDFARDISLSIFDPGSKFNFIQIYSGKYFKGEMSVLKERLCHFIESKSEREEGGSSIVMGSGLIDRLHFKSSTEVYEYIFGEKPEKKIKLRRKENLTLAMFLES